MTSPTSTPQPSPVNWNALNLKEELQSIHSQADSWDDRQRREAARMKFYLSRRRHMGEYAAADAIY